MIEGPGAIPGLAVTSVAGVAVVRIERPEVLNALDTPTRVALARTLRSVGEDPRTSAVVLTGSGGRAFCVGQDLREAGALDGAAAEAWMRTWTDLYLAIADLPVPSVAVIDGVATGAGFQLALLCDVRVASETARMGLREVHVGLPAITGMWLLGQMVGRSRTTELILTGRLMDAPEALRIGLVHALTAPGDCLARGVAVAADLASRPPLALRATRHYLRELQRPRMDEASAAAIRDQAAAIATGVPQQLMHRFLADRAARRSDVGSGRL
jgi:enoyl-CoA hydratase/carnithine racemase